MALLKELVRILDDEDEPLPKRIKLSKNAFLSSELHFSKKEDLIIKWLCKKFNINDIDQDSQLLFVMKQCLTSDCFMELKSNELEDKTKGALLKVLTKQIEDDTIHKTEIINLVTTLCESSTMNVFIKQNMVEFVTLLQRTLFIVSDKRQLNQLLEVSQIYFKTSENKLEVLNLFIKQILTSVYILFTKIDDIRARIVDFVHQIVFPNTFRKQYKVTIDQMFEIDSKKPFFRPFITFIDTLHVLYSQADLEKQQIYLDIYLSAFMKCFQSDSKVVFQFCVILTKIINLNNYKLPFNNKLISVKRMKFARSVSLFNIILKNLQTNAFLMDVNFHENLNFAEYLKEVILHIIHFKHKQSRSVFELLEILVTLNPKVTESIIIDILNYSFFFCKKDSELLSVYDHFIIVLFKMFSKLHREHKLISLILRTFSDFCLSQDTKLDDLSVEDVLSTTLIEYISEVISLLPGKICASLFPTIIYFVSNDLINNMENKINDEKFTLLFQFETQITICYFKSVTMIDGVRSDLIFQKFLNFMNEFKSKLSEIGVKLLNMEHFCKPMICFLQLCYTWGELSILLHNFKINDPVPVILSGDLLNENYLHNYLNADQWNTIEQRVANFGEVQCKQQMQKILNQAHRLSILNEDKQIELDFLKTIHFRGAVLNGQVVNTLNVNVIAEELFNHILNINNTDILNSDNIQENGSLVAALISVCLKKIAKNLKQIKNSNEEEFQSRLFIKKFNKISEINENNISESFNALLLNSTAHKDNYNSVISLANLHTSLEIFGCLPLAYCKEQRVGIILFLICLHSDFYEIDFDVKRSVEKFVEKILTINFPVKILYLINVSTILSNLRNFDNFEKIFLLIIKQIARDERLFIQLKDILKYCSKSNLKQRLKMTEQIFNTITEVKRMKFSKEGKKTILRTTYKLSKIVAEIVKNLENEFLSIGLYGLAIDRCMISDRKQILTDLLVNFNFILSNCLLYMNNEKTSEVKYSKNDMEQFINIVLKNKNKLKSYLPHNFVVQCGSTSNLSINYGILLAHLEIEQLQLITTNFVEKMKSCLTTNNSEELIAIIEVWKIFNSLKMNAERNRIRQEALESVLTEYLFQLNTKQNKEQILLILKFIYSFLRTQMPLSPRILDLIIEIICDTRLPLNCKMQYEIETFSEMFLAIIAILEVLFTFRSALFISRIQNVLICFRFLLNGLCENSQVKPDKFNEITVAKCAHSFQRVNDSIIKHKKDLVRLAPYLISDILQYYEKITFYSTVKTHLNNCLYSLLAICDSHANSYLLRNLSAASKEIFQVTVNNYNKYYKFTGRV